MAITRSPYKGTSRKLVFAFDIGTTYSGVCYAFLDPGVVPETKHVTTFLNNDRRNSKIPSTLYYDRDGEFRGAGDAARWDDAEKLDEIKWWKLKLAQGELPAEAKRHMTAELPKGRSIVDLFAHFIRYLFDSTIAHIKEVEPTGEVLWENFGPTAELILTHPNGWEGHQQEVMRKAVIQAGIFNEEEAQSRVSFVTEGEASFNYCVTNTKSGESLEVDQKVLVIDAGGGTIDISSYTVGAKSPLKVEELHVPKSKFKNSKFDTEPDLDAFTESFDKGLKHTFSEKKPQFVKFGSARDNDGRCDVRDGRLTLQGAQVAKIFRPSVNAILEAIKDIAGDLDPKNTFVFLVGGFAASPWLFQEVGRELAAFGLKLSRPDTQPNKAVAFGAISYYLNHFVTGRLVKYTYGAFAHVDFDACDPEHRRRSGKKHLSATGEFVLEAFVPILLKGTKVSDTEEFSDRFVCIGPFSPGVGPRKLEEVVRYKGKREKPQWVDLEPDNYETVCHVVVDTTKIPWRRFISPVGIPCFIQPYEVVYTYGQTELKAQLRWTEEGEEKRSDAAILYDEVVTG